MRRTIFIAAALALAVTLAAFQAQAQSIRTFVSTTGSDSNPCSITQPCRHFSAAVAATAVGGEVDALDAGAYGSFTISQAISIEGQGWSYVAPASGGNAITINAGSGDVNIRGVSLNGVGTTNTQGIQFNSGSTLSVRDSVIRNFTGDGIFFGPNASTLSQLFVANTKVSDNGGHGIAIVPSGSGTTSGVVSRVELENNSDDGLLADSLTQNISVTVSDSVSANNGYGIFAQTLSSTAINVMVRNSTIANNSNAGLNAQGSGAQIFVTRSTITGNATGWADASLGAVTSYGDNNIDGNQNANTEPPSPLTYK
jgi:hypothetical protein